MALKDEWLAEYREPMAFVEQPPRRNCGTMSVNQALMEVYPAFRRLLSALEGETAQRLAEPAAFAADEDVHIPVVVHVVHHTDAENISDAQVASQLSVLNADYAARNADAGSVPAVWRQLPQDSGIRFVLANRDPQGNAHPGITRTRTAQTGFGQDNGVKSRAAGGADAWPAEHYLNLWVCNLTGGLLGYAQFPGGPPETDGVVICHTSFGTNGTATAPFNLGRTSTHEVGHWLNLRHIWGDTEDCSGSDFVVDTPPQRLPNYNTPAFPHPSCNNLPNGDMFMNYMDYVDDAVMVMFTPGQVVRMRTTLSSIRSGLATSPGYVGYV